MGKLRTWGIKFGHWSIICLPLWLGSAAQTHPQGASAIAQNLAFQNQVTLEVKGDYRYITSNGIPDHQPGNFPNRGNPNRISPQKHQYRVPVRPQQAATITPMRRQPFGVALNGVPFDPGTAEFWNNDRQSGWRYNALSGSINLGLDDHHAHVQPTGAYHYHGLPTGLIASLSSTQSMILVGYAADGFPIYALKGYTDAQDANSELKQMKPSYRLKSGRRPDGPLGLYDGTFEQDYQFVQGAGDLDQCNGRVGVTPDYPQRIYHYYITETYPFIPRCFRGTPDSSFARNNPPPPRRPSQPPSHPSGQHPPGHHPPRHRPPKHRRPPHPGHWPPPPRHRH
ncbi:YHYH protein [Acaryochloris sp. IP29b_bin.137]|uniref:YHYH protein n=1 Tax=Acaryochloris sp. IP29b_bin.137 TaxID=2969217 RepID=UPI00260E1355|nr:YHYH protein [Acaryochloris sp. IP29b_bin.137]